MDARLRAFVSRRAHQCCEYCRFPAELSAFPHQIDHIIPEKHGGQSQRSNLALSCLYYNGYKGPNLAGIDPRTGEISRLFHPRRDTWSEHFRWHGARLVGLTVIARSTIHVLRINEPDLVAVRRELIACGLFPPSF